MKIQKISKTIDLFIIKMFQRFVKNKSIIVLISLDLLFNSRIIYQEDNLYTRNNFIIFSLYKACFFT